MTFLLARINHETNTFSPLPTVLADFEPLYGEAAWADQRHARTALGAFIRAIDALPGARRTTPVSATANPGGTVRPDVAPAPEIDRGGGGRRGRPMAAGLGGGGGGGSRGDGGPHSGAAGHQAGARAGTDGEAALTSRDNGFTSLASPTPHDGCEISGGSRPE